MTRSGHHNPLPRELAPGVHWLGQCGQIEYQGQRLHSYASVFLVEGDECSILVEGGLTTDVPVIERQLDALFATGVPEPRYLFVSHTEVPHSGGIGRFLQRFPEATACGDVEDLHLVFPEHADRFVTLDPGDSLPLGGCEFRVVEAVFRDMPYSRWGFDTRRRVLFASDGFSYCHYHEAGHCGSLAEEASSLGISDQVALFALSAFGWTQYTDVEPYISRLERLVFDELDARVIAPTHGLPIGDPAATLPEIAEGLRAGSRIRTNESIVDSGL